MCVGNEPIVNRMRRTSEALASSKRRLEETAGLLLASGVFVNDIRAVSAINRSPNEADFPICWICNKVVRLEMARTDENGCAVHEQCYMATIAHANGSE